MPKREFLTNQERERRIKAGLILPSFGGIEFNKDLIRDGAEWSFKVKAWLLPDQETYEKWVRMSISDLEDDVPLGRATMDPDEPYDRLSDVLGRRKRRKS